MASHTRTLRKARTKRADEILQAARAVFSEKGFEGAAMADIAARVGIVEGAIYKHFSGKRDLLFQVMRPFSLPMIEEMRLQVEGIDGARNRLRFVIWMQLRAFAEEPGLCRLVISEIRPLADYDQSAVRDLNRRLTSVARSIIEEGIASGEFRPDVEPAMVRDLIYGGIEHIAWRAVTGKARLDVERVADSLTALIVGGISAAPSEPPGQPARLREQVDRLERMLDAVSPVTSEV